MKKNDKVTIIPSITLQTAQLEGLVGRQGVVLELNYRQDGTSKGAWISLIGEPYLDEQEWFIPANSLSNV